MLDVAIGMIFFYVALSVIVTVVQELLASALKWRARNLQKAIVELIGSDLKKDFYTHPLIFPLFQGGVDDAGNPLEGGPSYIPRRNFALAVVDLNRKAAGGASAAAGPASPALAVARYLADAGSSGNLAHRVSQLDRTATEVLGQVQNEAVREALGEAVKAAVGDLRKAADTVDNSVRELEVLFDNTMNRASGWYKSKSQRVTLAISLALALVLNADSIHLAGALWEDDALRAQAVAAAEAYYASGAGQTELAAACGTADETLTPEQWRSVKACTRDQIAEAMEQIAAAGFPIGWPPPAGQNPWLAIPGWLITAAALSLGSSFWFDLLGKFMNVRMSGRREETRRDAPADA
jgi:hypothetical protein